MSARRSEAVKIALEFAVPVALVLAWQLETMHAHSKKFATPWSALLYFPHIAHNLTPTLIRLGEAFALGVAAGVAIGLPLGLSFWARHAAMPHVEYWRNMPPTAVLPASILLLHSIGDRQKVGFAFFFAAFPVLLNTLDAVRGIEPTMVDTARSYGVPRIQRIRRIVLPAALPQIVAGMRNSLALSLILILVAEYYSSTNGLGYVLLNSKNTFVYKPMWSAILMIGLLGYALNAVFLLFERRALAWHRGWRAATPQ